MIRLYNILIFIVLLIGFPLILPMIMLSAKRRKTVLQRLTLKSDYPPSELKPIWIHALSVGEVLSAVPIVHAINARVGKNRIVFSASTYTGFELAQKLFCDHAEMICYFPYDIPCCVRRAIQRINPLLMVMVETDIWPNFLFAMKASGIPVMLVNARLSDRSYTGYRRFSFFTKQIFAKFSKVCAQTQEDAARFADLGVPSENILVSGNVKFDQPEISSSDQDIVKLQRLLNPDNARKIIVAGSTHEGEEAILAQNMLQLKQEFKDLLLIIAPRDPNRAKTVRGILPCSSRLLSEIEQAGITADINAVVVDRIGILRKLYALADIAFVGGSLVNCGGHNPIEPAAFAKPVLFGPDMSSFKEISRIFIERSSAIEVQDAQSLYAAIRELLSDRKKAENIGVRAAEIFSANKGAVERTMQWVWGDNTASPRCLR
jgi:3-deoxy-D-manno-octulosonic-acid transferase